MSSMDRRAVHAAEQPTCSRRGRVAWRRCTSRRVLALTSSARALWSSMPIKGCRLNLRSRHPLASVALARDPQPWSGLRRCIAYLTERTLALTINIRLVICINEPKKGFAWPWASGFEGRCRASSCRARYWVARKMPGCLSRRLSCKCVPTVRQRYPVFWTWRRSLDLIAVA
eukprot:scaffold282915_cov28-Tisochrysis_lutea.AAC.4